MRTIKEVWGKPKCFVKGMEVKPVPSSFKFPSKFSRLWIKQKKNEEAVLEGRKPSRRSFYQGNRLL